MDKAKYEALKGCIEERERCKNADGSPYKVTHAEAMAFLNGYDEIKSLAWLYTGLYDRRNDRN